jgi:cyclophilin family peptidyl-prolyl cis-trans isomerase
MLLRSVLLLATAWPTVVSTSFSAAPSAASNLRAVTNSPFTFSLTWRDNSNNETEFIVGARPAGSSINYLPLGSAVAPNVTNFVAANLMIPGTTNQIAVFAVNNDGATISSSTLVVQMPRFDAPTNLAFSVVDPTSIQLRWRDGTSNESQFAVGFRQGTNGPFDLFRSPPALLAPNTTNFTGYLLSPAQTYQFFLQATYPDPTNGNGFVSSTNLTVVMPSGFLGRNYHPGVVGEPITPYTLTPSTARGAPSSYTLVGALPVGLTYNGGTHEITGTPQQAGVFTPNMVGVFPEGTVTNRLTIRVIPASAAPTITATIPKQVLTKGGPAIQLPLTGFFADPDTERALRFTTTKGVFDMALYPSVTPQTVSNFLGYVTRGDLNNSLVHRASKSLFGQDFVAQGGGFKPAGTNLTAVPTVAGPTNEPGIYHSRGTVALAKTGGNPHSATSQWFINMKDNSGELDDQNGGFTAFGRVLGNGMNVADSILALPTASYTINLNGTPTDFDDWPVDLIDPPPTTFDPTTAVLVNSVATVAPLAFAVVSNSVPGIVSASVVGTNLTLTPLTAFGGATAITVAATDLDSNVTAQTFTVEVASAYTTWLNQFALTGSNSLPAADGEGDGVVNAVEFALSGAPTLPDAAASRPRPSLTNISSQPYLALNFKLAKDLSGASVLIKAANQVTGAWTNLWSSSNLASPLVTRLVDQGSNYLITVRDTAPASTGATNRFLNLRVQLP